MKMLIRRRFKHFAAYFSIYADVTLTLYSLAWKNQIRKDVCEVNPQFTPSCGGEMLIIIMSGPRLFPS